MWHITPEKGYAVELRQLFQNLLTNGIKFSREGIAPDISIRAEREGKKHWRFFVSDNGIGIAAKHLSKIFLL
ncbi:MAG: hypothetical protein INR73_28575, partial [Williamsia sp.]|nr:hypothetical protein [Williamsia sp.]